MLCSCSSASAAYPCSAWHSKARVQLEVTCLLAKELPHEMVNRKLREIALALGKQGVDRQEQAHAWSEPSAVPRSLHFTQAGGHCLLCLHKMGRSYEMLTRELHKIALAHGKKDVDRQEQVRLSSPLLYQSGPRCREVASEKQDCSGQPKFAAAQSVLSLA